MKMRYNYFDRVVKNELGNIVYSYRYKYNFSKGFIEVFTFDQCFVWWFRHGFYKRNYSKQEWNKIVKHFKDFRNSDRVHF